MKGTMQEIELARAQTFGQNVGPKPVQQYSETGRIRFRRIRLQTPNSVSFVALAEFRGESSVSSSRLCVCQSKLTEFFAELTEFAVKLSEAQ